MSIDQNEYYFSIDSTEYNPYDKDIIKFSRLKSMKEAMPKLDLAFNGKILCCTSIIKTWNFRVYEKPDEWYYVNSRLDYYKCDQFDGLIKFIEDKILPQ